MNVPVVEGGLLGEGLKVAVVASRFNSFVVDRLVEGAVDALLRSGLKTEDICIFRTPGAFEIPQAAKQVAQTGRFGAVVCLGAVIRGQTPHFDYVAGSAATGITQVSLQCSIPLTFGVLTTDTVEQAVERADTQAGNKGADAALAAVEMANLYQAIGKTAKL